MSHSDSNIYPTKNTLLSYLSLVIPLLIYLPCDLIGIPQNRLIEIIIIFEIFLYFLIRGKIELPKFDFFIILYLLFSFFSLILIALKPDIGFPELKHITHFLFYSFFNICHYFILSSQKIISIKPLKIILVICSIFAIIFSINALLVTYSGFNEILQDSSAMKFQQGYLSLENELKQESAKFHNAVIYLGNSNGRSYNLLMLLSATIEILLQRSVIILPFRIITALFCGTYSYLSISRGALFLSTVYFLYALFEAIRFVIKSKNMKIKRNSYTYFFTNFFIFLLPFSLAFLLIFNKGSQLIELGSYFFATKSDFSPINSRLYLLNLNLEKIFQNPITILFGNGYMYMENFTRNNNVGVGQITWIEIATSSGIIAAVSYVIFLYSTVVKCLKNLNRRLEGYKNLFIILFLNIILVGLASHYLDKLPRTILMYFTLMGWFYAHNKTLNIYDKKFN